MAPKLKYLSDEEIAEGLFEIFDMYLPHLYTALSVSPGETEEQAEIAMTITRPTKLTVEEVNKIFGEMGLDELTQKEIKEIGLEAA